MAFVCPRTVEGPFVCGPAEWRSDYTCSNCGSVSEDAFWKAIDAGATLVPTDKNYKVYIRGDGAPVTFGMAKLYFQHLSHEGKARFVDYLNKKKVKIGNPGHFYVLPYFIAKAGTPTATPTP